VRIGKARRGGKRLLIKLDRLLVPVQLLKRDAEAVIGFANCGSTLRAFSK
jgi:hypothetical protein